MARLSAIHKKVYMPPGFIGPPKPTRAQKLEMAAKRRKAKALELKKLKRLQKYNAKGMYIEGRYFHSTAEAARYIQLKALETAGRISRLECQVKYAITMNGTHICNYQADFRYAKHDQMGDVIDVIIEDVKGMSLPVYQLKKKLLEAQYRIKLHEIRSGKVKHYGGKTADEIE
jgi:hypothetical protein